MGKEVNKWKASGGFQMVNAAMKDSSVKPSLTEHGLGKRWTLHDVQAQARGIFTVATCFLLLLFYTISGLSLVGCLVVTAGKSDFFFFVCMFTLF